MSVQANLSAMEDIAQQSATRGKDFEELKQYCSQYAFERVMYESNIFENQLLEKYEILSQKLRDMQMKLDEVMSDSKLQVLEDRLLLHIHGEVSQSVEAHLMEHQLKAVEGSEVTSRISEAALQGLRSEVDLLKRQQSMDRNVQSSLRDQQEARHEATQKELQDLKNSCSGDTAEHFQAIREEAFRNSTEFSRTIEEVSMLVEAAKVSMNAQFREEIEKWRAEASQASVCGDNSDGTDRLNALLKKIEGLGLAPENINALRGDLDETRDDVARLSQEVRNIGGSCEQTESRLDLRAQELRAERLAWASARQVSETSRTTVANKLVELRTTLASGSAKADWTQPVSILVNSISDLCTELTDKLRSELEGLASARAVSTEARMDSMEKSLSAEFKRVTGDIGGSVGNFQAMQRSAQREVAQLGPRVSELELAIARLDPMFGNQNEQAQELVSNPTRRNEGGASPEMVPTRELARSLERLISGISIQPSPSEEQSTSKVSGSIRMAASDKDGRTPPVAVPAMSGEGRSIRPGLAEGNLRITRTASVGVNSAWWDKDGGQERVFPLGQAVGSNLGARRPSPTHIRVSSRSPPPPDINSSVRHMKSQPELWKIHQSACLSSLATASQGQPDAASSSTPSWPTQTMPQGVSTMGSCSAPTSNGGIVYGGEGLASYQSLSWTPKAAPRPLGANQITAQTRLQSNPRSSPRAVDRVQAGRVSSMQAPSTQMRNRSPLGAPMGVAMSRVDRCAMGSRSVEPGQGSFQF
jgi:hypothetical protein